MIAGLIRKETRDLRPFLVLGAVLLLLDVAYWLTQQFDMQPLAGSFTTIDTEIGAALFLAAFALGTGLLMREQDDRTLAFLDGLPVSRLRVFVVKVAVAGFVLLLYPAGMLLLMAVQHLVARQSLDLALQAALLWQSFAMISVVIAVGLAVGLLFGVLRSLAWLALALCAIAINVLSRQWPQVAALNPMELLDVRLIGVHWQVPVTGLLLQLAAIVVCGFPALAIFLTAGGGSGRKLQLRLSRPIVSAAVTLATIGALIATIALYADSSQGDPLQASGSGDVPGARFVSSPAGSARTQRYSFSYPAQRAELVQALLRDADRTHDAVATLLGAGEGPRIDVDLSGSLTNTEGTAFHDRIRMQLGPAALATLAHETAHVLAHRLAGGERERELSKMSALNEGLAQWIENQVSGGETLPELGRLQAAIVSRRHLVTPEQLTDIESLARNADRNLQYPLGAVLVDVLVNRYGSQAPRRLLMVLADPNFPRDLQGPELWYGAFQAARFDLALVFDDYARRLKSWEEEFAERIANLPRPRGSLVLDEDLLGVEVRFDGQLPADWHAVVRFRPKEDSPLDRYTTEVTDDDNIAWIFSGEAVDEQVCFQPGVSMGEITIFESWVCLPQESAAALDE